MISRRSFLKGAAAFAAGLSARSAFASKEEKTPFVKALESHPENIPKLRTLMGAELDKMENFLSEIGGPDKGKRIFMVREISELYIRLKILERRYKSNAVTDKQVYCEDVYFVNKWSSLLGPFGEGYFMRLFGKKGFKELVVRVINVEKRLSIMGETYKFNCGEKGEPLS